MDLEQEQQALEDVFARWALVEHTPAIAWGLIRDGQLAAARGLGTLRVGEDAPPDADSVFRIASMTKSFTGAALMSLVVEGSVRLDEPVATYVPELAGWRGPTGDGPPLTVRHFVSMESGLPTDDPWADRHLDLPPDGMDALIAAGVTFTWTPGTRFEYSNLGWGIVGRVIERVAGVTPQQLVSERFLTPLGMTNTTWTRPAGANIAEPYRWEDGAWGAEPEPLGDGTIAPMGGLWSTVADLARWVTFFCDAYPPRDDPDEGPLPGGRAGRCSSPDGWTRSTPSAPARAAPSAPSRTATGSVCRCGSISGSARSSRTAAASPATARTCAGSPTARSASSRCPTSRTATWDGPAPRRSRCSPTSTRCRRRRPRRPRPHCRTPPAGRSSL